MSHASRHRTRRICAYGFVGIISWVMLVDIGHAEFVLMVLLGLYRESC
jgi:hypothetical protein